MPYKKKVLTNFTQAIHSESFCQRPDNETELQHILDQNKSTIPLARGAGLSYSDSCLNTNSHIIDTQRLNHFINFDSSTGILECQGGVTFKEMISLHPEFIPPVVPGTAAATVAGGIAHDVHGKNNHVEGSFARHILWLNLLIGDKTISCSRELHANLFHASIAGLGLTGVITRVGIRLKKASKFVQTDTRHYESIPELMAYMSTAGLQYDYQVAWLDLLSASPRGILSLAKHCETIDYKKWSHYCVPRMPVCLIKPWNIKVFNQLFFKRALAGQTLPLEEFNNPLDKVRHWNRLYGPRGLIQFQAVFAQHNAWATLTHLLELIKSHKATPTLAVLKLFTQNGEGLLSFCRPGFTLAVDFSYNAQSEKAIIAMNQYMSESGGRIYLGKDLLLNKEQFGAMYEKHKEFRQIISHYNPRAQSDMAKRLGICI